MDESLSVTSLGFLEDAFGQAANRTQVGFYFCSSQALHTMKALSASGEGFIFPSVQ